MDHPVAESNAEHTVPPPGSVAGGEKGGRSTAGALVALKVTVFILGCAAAALALFAMALPPAGSRVLGRCAPTDAEAAGLRAASEMLLLSASAQVLAALAALLTPAAPPVAYFAFAAGGLPAYRAVGVVWFLVACHGRVRGELALHFWFFFAVLLATLLVGLFTATR
ncbi:unnamed protein product [Urochloa humidicola]